MHVKITQSGTRRYIQLVESFRNEAGQPRNRTVATLGRVDQLSPKDVDALINGLLRATGRAPQQQVEEDDAVFASALSFGDTWTLSELWRQLGLGDAIRPLVESRRRDFDVEALLRVMVFNRLCEPDSKLGVLRWLETTLVPGIAAATVTHQRLLRAMDVLEDCKDAIEAAIPALMLPLLNAELSMVFYDMTTIAVDGITELPEEVRKYGRSKEGGTRRQCMLGVVQTAEGLPLAFDVFAGNTAEVTTLEAIVKKVAARLPIGRLILVADRGLLSLDNLNALDNIHLPNGQAIEFILAVPARRYGELADIVRALHDAQGWTTASKEQIAETTWNGYRLVVAHDPVRAQEQGSARDERIAAIEAKGEAWVQRLETVTSRLGKPLTDQGAAARFHHLVAEANLTRFIKTDFTSDVFTWSLDERELAKARLFDGKLVVMTATKDLDAGNVIERYKSLADIERGFRVLKSELEIGPMYHRLPKRIRAHALVCFLALLLHRVLRLRLKAGQWAMSPERMIELLRQVQYHSATLGTKKFTGITHLQPHQGELFAAAGVDEPSKSDAKTAL